MTVTYVNRCNEKRILSSEVTSFILPYSGSLVVKDIKDVFVYINGLSQRVSIGEITIQIEDKSFELEVDGEAFDIRVLCGQYTDEMKVDYVLIGKVFANNLIMNKLDWLTMEDAITMEVGDEDEGQLKMTLCTFNRKFKDVTSDRNLEDIAKCVDSLPHIFHRPKQHLKQVNEVRPAAVATRTGQESIRFLAAHSEHWKGIKANGLVPERLLVRSLEDDPAIYENLVVKTLTDRLYHQMRELNDQGIDCQMQISMDDTYTFGEEQKNYYHARNILLKGMDEDTVSFNQMVLEDQQKQIEHILERLSVCKGTPLYRTLKREKPVVGKLKTTNIFMMDKYYKQAYRLWNLLEESREETIFDGIQDVTNEYSLFCKILLVFALRYFNFQTEDDEVDLFEGQDFTDCIYSFEKWNIQLHGIDVPGIDTSAFELKLFISEPIEIDVTGFNITPNSISGMSGVCTEKDKIILNHVLSDTEQQELVGKCKCLWPEGKQNKFASNLKQKIYQALSYVKPKKKKILFVPWRHLLPDNTEEFIHLKEGLKCLVNPEGYEKIYFLTASRPNEFKEIKEEKILNQMLHYGNANKEFGLEFEEYGFIPISLGDINSYRRFTKILLSLMVSLDESHSTCPICGSQMSTGRGAEANVNTCVSCGYKLIETQCSCCKKKFMFSRYGLPSTIEVDNKETRFVALVHENELSFKNITEARIENEQIAPCCPYCGE